MNEEKNKENMQYHLQLMETEAGIGYFSCIPAGDTDIQACFEYIRNCPNDEFMRRYLMAFLSTWEKDELEKEIGKCDPADKIRMSLFCDICLFYEKFRDLQKYFSEALTGESATPEFASPDFISNDLSAHTPLICLRYCRMEKRELHRKWIRFFAPNILEHRPLQSPEECGLPPLFSPGELKGLPQENFSADSVAEELRQMPPLDAPPRPEAKETIRRAMRSLSGLRIIAEAEMRHEASLSPIALMRKWNMNIRVKNGRHDYVLSGIQTSYGRGMELEAARAAYMMEMVERYSSFASFDNEGISGYEKEYPLTFGRYSELAEKGYRLLNPNELALEAPYPDAPLYWIEGEAVTGQGNESILIPAQCVFLFCNLDEIQIFSGLGSTGLAAGNTPEEAKVSALLENIERHCEGVTPFTPAQCFEIETEEPRLNKLLDTYREAGIRVQFREMTSPMGIPCCKCFVMTQQGQVIKGTGAHLNARQALLSALTETPYPFLKGEPSGYGLHSLIRVPLENLRDYSMNNAAENLRLLEKLLTLNGYCPVYVNLTRKDTGIPVVRALIPGMEITADFDRFSRVHPRLYANYLQMFTC
ncbi:MAG: YcaO-like family protein [Desulfococcaceae bacterium]|jgi:YcaO-like protein with predicted kinase domain|nr:YcaO-like family protein [Desulfococcaceae bacterium]